MLGRFEQKLSELTADQCKASMLDGLTEGQKETLKWVGTAVSIWKASNWVSSVQIADAKTHLRPPTFAETENQQTTQGTCQKGILIDHQKRPGHHLHVSLVN